MGGNEEGCGNIEQERKMKESRFNRENLGKSGKIIKKGERKKSRSKEENKIGEKGRLNEESVTVK